MNLLVAGSEHLDAGKTTFSAGLVERTGAVGYKPRAGNDFWYSHDDVLAAADDGVLYGKDARKLAAVGPDGIEPADINVVHRLWRPLPGGVGGVLGQDGREFLLDRAGETYVVNGTTAIPDVVRRSFPIESAVRVESLAEFNDVMAGHHQPVQADLLAEIEAQPLSVIESYGSVARPLSDLDHDVVAVVEPRRVRVYEGRRYDRSCSVASGSPGPDSGTLEERVADVTDLIDPVETVEIPPLPESVRHDPAAIAAAYEPAYDALLSAAGS
ncbi:ATPase [Halapricum hydrolyticum]|uniref:ATPase n=1 Tax=Halapricum hydrolyticum TaxID=2979991 RepID=A0AAE3LG37_9EURY|nr:ATPase [Halapricum hydrolyticum]MCU4719206.1 ATPase [Halapricum hydrolyticum]MCU4728297.1 ATPase [Halapricum hydrolyticum]